MKTITVMPTAEWLTAKEAAALLGRSERRVQAMGKTGQISRKPAGRKDQPHAMLYDAHDLERIIAGERSEAIVPPTPLKAQNGQDRAAKREESKALVRQEHRALDTVSIVGNLAIAHKGEMETLIGQSTRQIQALVEQFAQQMQNIVGLILTSHKAEADANRERLKAEREDARERWEADRGDAKERWEIERQDRLAKLERQRQENRTGPMAVPAGKAKAAGAK